MDINEIKQVPIVDFLYVLGIEPVKHKASGLWYHAPYRNDRNPSLRVSTDKNVWYDYGIARGGDIFNLAGEFINSNEFVAQAKFISETLGGSFPTSFPHYQRIAEKAVKVKGNPFSDIVEKPLSHPALRQYLRERGISADVASRFCCQVVKHYSNRRCILAQYIEFSLEQKERAATVDLEEFLLRQGEKLIKSGREKRLASDHSVTVHGCE